MTMEFSVAGEVQKGVIRTHHLGLQKAEFSLFTRLVDRVHWEAVLKGPGVQGRPDTAQKGSLKGIRTGYPHVLEDKSVGKKAHLAEKRGLVATQGKKKRVCDGWKKGQYTWEDYMIVTRV